MIIAGNFTAEKITRASRLSLAMLISVAYITYFGIAEGIAVTMTAAIVLYDNPTVGGAINKSYLRFLGTLFGFLFAMVFIIGFANNMLINVIGMSIGIFMAAYWFIDNKYSYIGIMICATLPILLLNNGDLRIAFLRLFSISLGAVIAYLLACFFYHDYARDRVVTSMHKLISQIYSLLNSLQQSVLTAKEFEQLYHQQEEAIIKEFAKFVRWQSESIRETSVSYSVISAKIFSHIRHIYHLISILATNFELEDIYDSLACKMRLESILASIREIISELAIDNDPQTKIYETTKKNNLITDAGIVDTNPSINISEISVINILQNIDNELSFIKEELINLKRIRK